MNIQLADVMLHVDQALDADRRHRLTEAVREDQGVVGVGLHDFAPHLMLIAYNPASTSAASILQRATAEGLRAELVGF